MHILYKTILRSFGVKEIEAAYNGWEAVWVMQKFSPDIIITEQTMPSMNGIELTKTIRDGKRVKNRHIPIIMSTAHSYENVVHSARDAGINEFLVKPISAHTLYAHIAAIIRAQRSFITTSTYCGPDRRHRKPGPKYKGPRRRHDDWVTPAEPEIHAVLQALADEPTLKPAPQAPSALPMPEQETRMEKAKEEAEKKVDDQMPHEKPLPEPGAMSQAELAAFLDRSGKRD